MAKRKPSQSVSRRPAAPRRAANQQAGRIAKRESYRGVRPVSECSKTRELSSWAEEESRLWAKKLGRPESKEVDDSEDDSTSQSQRKPGEIRKRGNRLPKRHTTHRKSEDDQIHHATSSRSAKTIAHGAKQKETAVFARKEHSEAEKTKWAAKSGWKKILKIAPSESL
ncbi:hypothetical protein BDV96DRAFT_337463 [Lophiotrema nucula]|uniref:Uncharacterized protein n=1 Tax=Lophiotrema nucula TaxID=690887 RepID=A0A6A5YG32_9PLEO|nr:hypothetical protein BDV96DRAFT_337463 [Lophiotrema nucula]